MLTCHYVHRETGKSQQSPDKASGGNGEREGGLAARLVSAPVSREEKQIERGEGAQDKESSPRASSSRNLGSKIKSTSTSSLNNLSQIL